MSEFNSEDLDAVISEAKSSLVQMLALQLKNQLKHGEDMAVQLANAESKCGELAAELSAVDKIHNEAVFITDDHYEQCPPEVQKIIRSLAVLQIPACDVFLAEVRAQGVEMAACALDDVNQFNYANMLDELAQKLRKGAAQ